MSNLTEHDRQQLEMASIKHRLEAVEATLNALLPHRIEAQRLFLKHGLQSPSLLCPNDHRANSVQKRAVLILHAEHWSFSRIAQLFGKPEKTIQRWCSKPQPSTPTNHANQRAS